VSGPWRYFPIIGFRSVHDAMRQLVGRMGDKHGSQGVENTSSEGHNPIIKRADGEMSGGLAGGGTSGGAALENGDACFSMGISECIPSLTGVGVLGRMRAAVHWPFALIIGEGGGSRRAASSLVSLFCVCFHSRESGHQAAARRLFCRRRERASESVMTCDTLQHCFCVCVAFSVCTVIFCCNT